MTPMAPMAPMTPMTPMTPMETSREAGRIAAEIAPEVALRIFSAFERAGAEGLTCWEIEQTLGIPHQTASARVHELAKAGCILATEHRRKTTRAWATVYRWSGTSFSVYTDWRAAAGKVPSAERVKSTSPALSKLIAAALRYKADLSHQNGLVTASTVLLLDELSDAARNLNIG